MDKYLPFDVAPQGALCCCLGHWCSLYVMIPCYCLIPIFQPSPRWTKASILSERHWSEGGEFVFVNWTPAGVNVWRRVWHKILRYHTGFKKTGLDQISVYLLLVALDIILKHRQLLVLTIYLSSPSIEVIGPLKCNLLLNFVCCIFAFGLCWFVFLRPG